MGQQMALMWFLWLVIIILAIAVIVIVAGFVRSKRRASRSAPDGAGIQEGQQPVAERLGEQYPHQYGEDPRGEDIGGNFSTKPAEDDTSQGHSERATSQKQP